MIGTAKAFEDQPHSSSWDSVEGFLQVVKEYGERFLATASHINGSTRCSEAAQSLNAPDVFPQVVIFPHLRVKVPKDEKIVLWWYSEDRICQLLVELVLCVFISTKSWSVDRDQSDKVVGEEGYVT